MAQDTTVEFGKRFTQAVEAHPLAPVSPHGRQRWVLDKLKKETGTEVSPNTMSKWFHGTARPRADNVRKLAQILSVDEVWLAMGKKPVEKPEQMKVRAANASGAVLMAAGLIEINGGRVTFPDPSEAYDLHVNLLGSQFTAVIVTGREQEDSLSCIVPEPVGNSRVLVVVLVSETKVPCTVCVDILDLTSAPRQSLGGYSVITLKRDKGKFVIEGHATPIHPLRRIDELT